MAKFKYDARDKHGELIQGDMDAADQDTVASALVADNLIPLRIQAIEAKRPSPLDFDLAKYFANKSVPLDDMVLFCRQMHALTRSGIPIIRAVLGLAETSKNPYLCEILKDVGRVLGRGTTLSSALKAHRHAFSPLFISMVHVGESTGQLDEAFQQLVLHLEMERDTRKKVKSAFRYPLLVIGAILVAMVVVNLFVIPSFAKVFAKFGNELPFASQILLSSSNFFVHYWYWLLLLLIASVVAFIKWTRTAQGALKWDEYKLKLPLIGDLLRRIALSRFTRTFAMLFRSGVPILSALDISAEAIGNVYIESAVKKMRLGIEKGDSLSRTAHASGMFTPLILQMITVGEESGALDKLLTDVSDFYDEETDYEVKGLSAAIEPIMLVCMGVMILVLALGIFLPLWDLGATRH